MFKFLTHHQLDLPAVKTVNFFRPRDLLCKFCVWLRNRSMETARNCSQLTVFRVLHTADVSFASNWLCPSTCISKHINYETLSQQWVYPVASLFRCYVWRNPTTKSTYVNRQRWTSLSLQLTGECKIRLLGAHRDEITDISKNRFLLYVRLSVVLKPLWYPKATRSLPVIAIRYPCTYQNLRRYTQKLYFFPNMLVHKINTTLRTTLVMRGDREGVIEREFQNYMVQSETMDLK